MINVQCWLSNPLHTKTSWVRPQIIRRLWWHQPNHNPQPIPTPHNAGTTRSNSRSAVLHQNQSKNRIPSRPDEGGRGMENRLLHSLWPLRILHNAISGKKFCVRMLHMHWTHQDSQDVTQQGILHPDKACKHKCCTESHPPMHMHTRQKWAVYWPSE